MIPHNNDSISWPDALQEELDFVNKRRPASRPINHDLVGLAISGGGIRSATFGLGVIESLKRLGLLKHIDYLSTVSGGGYIGAWLSGNCKRAADQPGAENWLYSADEEWERSITHLRRYSNYLSPDLGFFSADTWSMLTIWLRNTILVQITVILAIAVVLLAPRPLFFGFRAWYKVGDWRWTTICLFIFGAVGIAGNLWPDGVAPRFKYWRRLLAGGLFSAALAIVLAVYFHFVPFPPRDDEPTRYPLAAVIAFLMVVTGFLVQPAVVKLVNRIRGKAEEVNYTQSGVQGFVVLPMMAVGMLVAAILWQQSTGALASATSFGVLFTTAWRYWPLPLTIVFTSLLLLSLCSIQKWNPASLTWAVLAPIPSVAVLHALLCAIVMLLQTWALLGDEGQWLAFIWAPSFVLYAFSLTVVILIGIIGRESTEGVREWWSRFGAWLAIYGAAWMIITIAAIYGPYWVADVFYHHPWKGLSVSGAWIGTTIGGLLAGGSGDTGGKNGKKTKSVLTKVLELVAAIAPFVFIAGLLVAVGAILHLIISINSPDCQGLSLNLTWALLWYASPKVTFWVFVACAAALLLMAARVDINQFSLNAFYRNRLVRCYLGATRKPGERHPQNFTGFDDCDDLPLSKLATPLNPLDTLKLGPFHIVNCALNLGGSSDLSVHTRHSANFTLTPLHCGSSYSSHDLLGNQLPPMGFTSTDRFSEEGGPLLGQAISVSGAAASPNMGYHTSPVVAFLLTLFNVRLGWWFPNPEKSRVRSTSPSFSLSYLVMELFGLADDKSKFLAISDGGHFENMGAYELIKRKCKVVIISDAECDPCLQFEGLGTLIRMCKVDLQAIITIDVGPIGLRGDSEWSGTRSAVGSIRYADGTTGTLIYLKASMTGHEGTAILQYKAAHPAFPHESTGNQFYREDQFESYRSLGNEISTHTFAPVARTWNLAEVAEKLEDIWAPPLLHVSGFTRNSARLMELWAQLSKDSNLQSLDRELAGSWPANPSPEFRSSFYACCQMIQLMENVYLDLDLEKTWDQADNKGWRTMFEVWANSPMVQQTWQRMSNNYGTRFRYFCNRYLYLPLDDSD